MNIEHRTSNIERPTSNNVFCQFKKKTEQHAAQAPALHERIYPSKLVCLRKILRFACFKIDKAQRHQYWTFDVGRSMFDVQLSLDHVFSVIHCSGHDARKKQIL